MGYRLVLTIALVATGVSSVATAIAAPTPPYLAQVKPVWGDVFVKVDDGRKWTYRGDYILAIFDYDGNSSVKSLPYTVCHNMTRRVCVKRVWRGRPDVFLVYVSPQARRTIDFTWHSRGRQRAADRIWVYE